MTSFTTRETDQQTGTSGLSVCGDIARRSDPDRFFCSLFLPAALREDAFTLIAFNHESVRALTGTQSRSVAGPLAGMIRLQWWREIVEGAPHPHAVADPLRALVAQGRVERRTLLGILDAREAELDGLADRNAWREAMRCGAGGVQRAIAEAAGVRDEDALRAVASRGAAFGMGGLLRHLDAVLRGGRCPLPEDALNESGLSRDAVQNGVDPARLGPLRALVRQEGLALLHAGRTASLPRAARGAALPGVLARRDLARDAGAEGDAARGLGDRLAVLWAALTGRV
ncbi:phytoene synthase [Gluconacetobacter johannae DSM 13595]|uniref:Squalene/phytoene synthase family protein n=2 Tax=Gluconacetobacter johannae TaxID=112140 RepID=A0A7W4J499_9PROT|nr:squalene/phytoene synthase family protein [Gluconacetobacter johannae]MBB2174455.1 squalene/phytoene synthase family protein [Gluconacetobacter johannae]GBQ84780.1 phytoene synthase [Gluconacetobacter johannae DSM 13595]